MRHPVGLAGIGVMSGTVGGWAVVTVTGTAPWWALPAAVVLAAWAYLVVVIAVCFLGPAVHDGMAARGAAGDPEHPAHRGAGAFARDVWRRLPGRGGA